MVLIFLITYSDSFFFLQISGNSHHCFIICIREAVVNIFRHRSVCRILTSRFCRKLPARAAAFFQRVYHRGPHCNDALLAHKHCARIFHAFCPVPHPFSVSPAIGAEQKNCFSGHKRLQSFYKRFHLCFFQLLCPHRRQPSANAFPDASDAGSAADTSIKAASCPAVRIPSATASAIAWVFPVPLQYTTDTLIISSSVSDQRAISRMLFPVKKIIYRTVFCTVVLLESHSRPGKIAVHFPVSDHQIFSSFIFNKSSDILNRVSEKCPDLMGEAHSFSGTVPYSL